MRSFEAQSEHHGEEQVRVRLAQRQPSGILFKQPTRQFCPDWPWRVLAVYPAEKHGKISQVHGIFLAIVRLDLSFGDLRACKQRAGPMVLAVHDGQELVAKMIARKRLNHNGDSSVPYDL